MDDHFGDVAGSPKGPFKGKGGMARLAGMNHAGSLPTRRTIADLRLQLEEAELLRWTLFEHGGHMVGEFQAKYRGAPARLVRYADRTLNDYRWRLSGSVKWRHLGLPTNKATLELTGETGLRILNGLPTVAREDWLRFEASRLQLNHDSAVAKYQILRLRQLIERQEALRQLVRGNAVDG